METLGLSSPPQKNDNILQRLFWPTISNQYDVDLLGQQGFWVCILIGAVSGAVLLVTGHFFTALLTAFIFFSGACGVRQRNVLAASLVLAIHATGLAIALFVKGVPSGNPLVSIVILMLLLANVRAAVISNRWMAAPPEDADTDLPDRSTQTATDRFANVMPVTLWPRLKYIFFIFSALYLALTLLGAFFLSTHKLPMTQRTQRSSQSVPVNSLPSR